jgi:hypothetical protein
VGGKGKAPGGGIPDLHITQQRAGRAGASDANFPALAAKTGTAWERARVETSAAFSFLRTTQRVAEVALLLRAKQAYRLSIASPFPMQARPPTIASRQPAIVTTWDHGGAALGAGAGSHGRGQGPNGVGGPTKQPGRKIWRLENPLAHSLVRSSLVAWHTPRHFWALGTRWAEEIERHGGGVAPAGGDTRARPVPQEQASRRFRSGEGASIATIISCRARPIVARALRDAGAVTLRKLPLLPSRQPPSHDGLIGMHHCLQPDSTRPRHAVRCGPAGFVG